MILPLLCFAVGIVLESVLDDKHAHPVRGLHNFCKRFWLSGKLYFSSITKFPTTFIVSVNAALAEFNSYLGPPDGSNASRALTPVVQGPNSLNQGAWYPVLQKYPPHQEPAEGLKRFFFFLQFRQSVYGETKKSCAI